MLKMNLHQTKTTIYLFILFLISIRGISAQNDVRYIKGYKFEFKRTLIESEYSSKLDVVIYLYRDNQYVLKHYEKRHFGDCNNDYISYGDYLVNDDVIVFNTEYSQSGEDPIPEKRKQRYQVSASGRLVSIYDKEYYPDSGWINSTFKE
jgi:hypothetical protein